MSNGARTGIHMGPKFDSSGVLRPWDEGLAQLNYMNMSTTHSLQGSPYRICSLFVKRYDDTPRKFNMLIQNPIDPMHVYSLFCLSVLECGGALLPDPHWLYTWAI